MGALCHSAWIGPGGAVTTSGDASAAGFYNMSNRMAAAVEMQPNPDYHGMAR